MPTQFLEGAAANFRGKNRRNPTLEELREKPELLLIRNSSAVSRFSERFPRATSNDGLETHTVSPLRLSCALEASDVTDARVEVTSVCKSYDAWLTHARSEELDPQYYINYFLAFTPKSEGAEPDVHCPFLSTLSTDEQIRLMNASRDKPLPDETLLAMAERLRQVEMEFIGLFQTGQLPGIADAPHDDESLLERDPELLFQ